MTAIRKDLEDEGLNLLLAKEYQYIAIPDTQKENTKVNDK